MSRRSLGIVVFIWLVLAAIGIGAMLDFELTPARATKVIADWPAHTSLKLDPYRPTLVMFIHPHCPCSRASLAELSVLATKCHGQANLQVIFVKPDDCEAGWERSDLLGSAAAIPGVTVAIDANGAEAARFSATTSGETMLFDRDGRRVFHGGITVSRGHHGDNPGLTAIAGLVGSGQASLDATPVYGCSLFNQCTTEDSQPVCQP